MNLNKASLVISAVKEAQYPKTKLPEVAFAGRSNVGKSSFINKMLNRKNLARTSSKPGKTATINFYNIDDTLMLVDLPGYGYAEVSKAEKAKWSEMINHYIYTRENLMTTFLVVDSRHKPSADDVTMYNFLKESQGCVIIIATKTDKVKKSELSKNLELIKETLSLDGEDVLIPFSAEKGEGVPDAWEVLYDVVEQSNK
ncbi:MAG: YihA family ribosome biogenesis GTP-binding protein [Clostridia bacterium]|nr:YihA family ribosome biogenesis GTP-binding protein [Clostridia bacterium]